MLPLRGGCGGRTHRSRFCRPLPTAGWRNRRLCSSSWFRTRTMGSKDPCAAVTPRRNVRERIGHVCPTAFRHADPTLFADWIPGPVPWPNTLLIGQRMVRESNSPGTSAPTVLAGLRLCRTAHHPCRCLRFRAHRLSLDRAAKNCQRFRGG